MSKCWWPLILILFSALSYGFPYPITYPPQWPVEKQQSFEQAWKKTYYLLPPRIQQELPENLSLEIKDLNPELDQLEKPSCNKKHNDGHARYGRYRSLSRTLQIDDRLAEKLLIQDMTPLDCGHNHWYQLAQATVLHELIHAWDSSPSLSNDPALRRLGFWEYGWLGSKQKNVRPQRLADAYAYRNPEEFLAVNMEFFLLDKDWSCRQPALYQYLADFFQYEPFDRHTTFCDAPLMVHYGEWPVLKTLDVSRIYRIDYLLAAAGDDMVSHFGHSMFRLVICAPEHYSPLIEAQVPATPYGPECLNDEAYHLVVSFRANVDDVVLSYWKGLTGVYGSRPYILPYLQVKEEYTSDQLRSMTLYPLQLSAAQQDSLIKRTLEAFWTYGGDYRFITNNCAVESLQLLQASLFHHPLQRYSSLTPKGVLENLQKASLVVAKDPNIITIPSREAELEKFWSIAFSMEAENKIPLPFSDVHHYLAQSRADERSQYFTIQQTNSVEKIAAWRILEQQIKRVHLRQMTLLAKYHLREIQGEAIKDLLSPLQADTLTVAGYGVPYLQEISVDENGQREKIAHLKGEVIDWLKSHEPAQWKEYENILHNLETLDILAARNHHTGV